MKTHFRSFVHLQRQRFPSEQRSVGAVSSQTQVIYQEMQTHCTCSSTRERSAKESCHRVVVFFFNVAKKKKNQNNIGSKLMGLMISYFQVTDEKKCVCHRGQTLSRIPPHCWLLKGCVPFADTVPLRQRYFATVVWSQTLKKLQLSQQP